MTTFPRHPLQLDRPHSGSSHSYRTSLTPSTHSTAPRDSTTTAPRTPSPYLPNPPPPNITQHDGLPSIRIDDEGEEKVEEGRYRRKSLERTRTWAEEVERNRNRSERKGKERVKAVQDDENSPYGQPFWSVSTEVMDSLVEALSPSSSQLSHLPSAAKVIAASRRRSYRIDSDSDEGESGGEEDEWWNEDTYRQKGRSTSMRLQVIQPQSHRERRTSERARKSSSKMTRNDEKDRSIRSNEKIALISLPSPTTPITPTTPNIPAKTFTPTTPILSIDDIIRKHSPVVTNAENVVKEKARKEIEDIRPRLASIRPKSMDVLTQTKKESRDTKGLSSEMIVQSNHESISVASAPQNSSVTQNTSTPDDMLRTRKISFAQSSTPSGSSRANSLPNVKPILRTSQSTHSTPRKSALNTGVSSGQAIGTENESLESLSQEVKMTTALLDQLEQLEKSSTITSISSTPTSSRRISFRISPDKRSCASPRPMTPTRNFNGNGNGKLSKRKSMPESSLVALQSQAQLDIQNHSYAVYLRSTHLNKIISLPRQYPETPLHISLAEVGNPHGKPVIIFLGLGCVRYLISLFDDFAKTFNLRLICIDRWGYGKTDQVSSDKRNPLDWADIVTRVLDVLEIRDFQILAHSAGSPYAMALALRMRNRVKGKVHLLAPWVGADIDGGYKWLKYIPNTVIKSATAAEWKLQSYLIGKPPPLRHSPISHDANAPVSSEQSSRTTTPLPDEDVFEKPREKRISMIRSSNRDNIINAVERERRRPQTSPSPGLVRRASKRLLTTPSKTSVSKNMDRRLSRPELSRSDSPTKNIDSRIVIPIRQDSGTSLTSISSSLQTSLKTPTSISRSSLSPGSRARSSSVLDKDDEIEVDGLDIYPNERFDLRSSNSLDSQFVTSPISRSALIRTQSYTTSSTSPSAVDYGSMSAPSGEGFSTVLNQASHAECEPGTTSDLLSIVLNKNKDDKPWGFSYTDYSGSVKVYYGSLDDKINEKSMRWMERSMNDVELMVREGEGHNLMTSQRVMWDVFESLGRDARGR
ncbi:hypothetical protein L486_06541 [Kwoniella mangroviensis CBS 10435]|uniref:AB hydrolase-1 domain-containing protein n=1 Tax=Kwoniella mangroviensis CBS 10435 TaxID=1331196 RepID=A0A1B9IJD4_9TREE|nr:hypothetical protein L486_06541 [Kwoniella mangroviensis CBS 10435]